MKIIVTTRDGEAVAMDAEVGQSALNIVRGAGNDELPGICGGSKSCATCHIYIADDWMGRLPSADDYESDLLESSEFRKESSRLACQVIFDPALDGLQITIAPEG